MNAGDLDRKIGLIVPASEALSDWGEQSVTFAAPVVVSAQKAALRLSDLKTAESLSQAAEAKFVIRWRSDVTIKSRVEFEGRSFEIIAVEEIGRRVGLALIVRAA